MTFAIIDLPVIGKARHSSRHHLVPSPDWFIEDHEHLKHDADLAEDCESEFV